MREMHWSWEDLLAAPADVVERVVALLLERQGMSAES